MNKANYGLPTAITMLIGIVVGSGIFFKADDVLRLSGGDLGLGIILFALAALNIIFGCLALTEMAGRSDIKGGLVGYYESFISPKAGVGFGWFQVLVYFPTINAIVAWVGSIYICSFWGIEASLAEQVGLAVITLTLLFLINTFSLRLGGYLQNLTVVIKLIPLLIIGGVGIWQAMTVGLPATPTMNVGLEMGGGLAFLGALAPIAFSYDGWQISLSISTEIKNPKRNMPLALVIAPVCILLIYVAFMIGMTSLIGADQVIALGNDAVTYASEILFGAVGSKIMLFLVIIAVYGVVNGVTLGYIRMPEAMASKSMFPNSQEVGHINPRFKLSMRSAFIAWALSMFWLAMHYVVTEYGFLANSDISEISIVFGYVFYTWLYLTVFRMYRRGEVKSTFKGLICPLLGTLGSLFILFASVYSNPLYAFMFFVFCMLVAWLGFHYYEKHQQAYIDPAAQN